ENRVNHNTTIDDDLWTKLRFISFTKKDNMNDLLEEAIEHLIEKYSEFLPKELRNPKNPKISKFK
ncbi:MAG TPA: hypothetical protein VIM42_09110, partial [Clostridium sp.]